MEPMERQRGQASAELVAVVPLLLVALLALGQLVVAGWALVSAGEAARAGARAAHVGADVTAAARRVIPSALGDAEVRSRASGVTVSLAAPALLPGLPALPVSASAGLDPGAGGR